MRNRVTRTKDVYIMSKICTQVDLTACRTIIITVPIPPRHTDYHDKERAKENTQYFPSTKPQFPTFACLFLREDSAMQRLGRD